MSRGRAVLLEVGDLIEDGDEIFSTHIWPSWSRISSNYIGDRVTKDHYPIRRRDNATTKERAE